jgi:hypothetical protein
MWLISLLTSHFSFCSSSPLSCSTFSSLFVYEALHPSLSHTRPAETASRTPHRPRNSRSDEYPSRHSFPSPRILHPCSPTDESPSWPWGRQDGIVLLPAPSSVRHLLLHLLYSHQSVLRLLAHVTGTFKELHRHLPIDRGVVNDEQLPGRVYSSL